MIGTKLSPILCELEEAIIEFNDNSCEITKKVVEDSIQVVKTYTNIDAQALYNSTHDV